MVVWTVDYADESLGVSLADSMAVNLVAETGNSMVAVTVHLLV